MEVLAGSESKGITAVLRICVALAFVLRRGKQDPSKPKSFAPTYAHTCMHVDIPGDDDRLTGLEHSIHVAVAGHVESHWSKDTGTWSDPDFVVSPYLRIHGMAPALNYGMLTRA